MDVARTPANVRELRDSARNCNKYCNGSVNNVNVLSSSHQKTLSFYYCNARSLVNKRAEFDLLLRQYDILSITETWFNESITHAMYNGSNNFNVYRKDRNSRGGGVAVFVKKCYKSCLVKLNECFENVEAIAIDIIGDQPFRIVTAYRPPNYDLDKSKLLCEFLSVICDVSFPVIIAGDFNYPSLSWGEQISYPDNVQYNLFFDTIISLGLEQLVNEPTRTDSVTGTSNFLDLLFCTDEAFIFDTKVTEPFIASDHSAIVFKCKSPFTLVNEILPSVRDYGNANWDRITRYLDDLDWTSMFSSCQTVHDYWDVFSLHLNKAITVNVPTVRLPINSTNKSNKASAYPPFLKRLINRKRRLYRVRNHSALNKEKYRALNKRFKKESFRYAAARERKILGSGDKNKLYKYIRKQRCNDNGVSPLKDNCGNIVVTDIDKANLLNSCFSSFFTADDGKLPSVNRKVAGGVSLANIEFTPFNVRKVMRKLRPKKSRTPDNLPSIVFKKLADSLCSPLSVIFNVSFITGSLPEIWKLAHVVPIFKKGDSSDPENYRPISLTPVACKIMETCICDKMMSFFKQHNVISRQQHGFLSKHSTCTQLLESIYDWSLSLNDKKSVDVVYIDFKKAFDSVSHPKLLLKLQASDISGLLYNWIENFLKGRTQKVVIGNSLSDTTLDVISGIPQGSNLGPLMFVMFVNDIPDSVDQVTCKMFADDVKLYYQFELSCGTVIQDALTITNFFKQMLCDALR